MLRPTAKLLGQNMLLWRGRGRRRRRLYYITRDNQTSSHNLEALFRMLSEGRITVLIRSVTNLKNIREAHQSQTAVRTNRK